jgi:hypothetical protein
MGPEACSTTIVGPFQTMIIGSLHNWLDAEATLMHNLSLHN